MLNFNSILLSSEDHKALADFYKKVFQKEPEMSEDTYTGFLVGSCFLSIGAHDKIHGKNTNPDRILFNFETKSTCFRSVASFSIPWTPRQIGHL